MGYYHSCIHTLCNAKDYAILAGNVRMCEKYGSAYARDVKSSFQRAIKNPVANNKPCTHEIFE